MAYPYQDRSRSVDERVEDLVSRLPVERKAAMMFQAILAARDIDLPSVTIWDSPTGRQLLQRGLNHLNLMGSFKTTREYVEFYNCAQRIAMDQPFGVPLTLSSDPRHAFREVAGHSMSAGVFSAWPEHMGMAALRSTSRMAEFADIVRQEYIAVGIRAALHPQTDLCTEYRWSRSIGGLGEDADVAAELVAAHVAGLQGSEIGPQSVTACVKHFPGGGPASKGLDPHFAWGAEQVYPGDNFEYHLRPFRRAVSAGTRVVMPSYGKPMGTKYEEVAMAYNKGIITDLLRGELGYDGIVLADWCVISDLPNPAVVGDLADAKAWGVEHLSREERIIRALDAGVDQFGGEYCEDVLIKLVKNGKVSEERIDASARKLLRVKFELGLFDQPYVDVAAAEAVVGRNDFRAAGLRAQMDSLTLLKNDDILPLKAGAKVFLEGFKDVSGYNVVDSPAAAEVGILRLRAPFEIIGKGAFAHGYHHGSLEFPQGELDRIAAMSKDTKVIIDIFAERPLVLGSLDTDAAGIVLNYGASDMALLKVLFAEDGGSPRGKLPFDLPRSNAAVAESRTDVQFDTKEPVYKFGHGLEYQTAV